MSQHQLVRKMRGKLPRKSLIIRLKSKMDYINWDTSFTIVRLSKQFTQATSWNYLLNPNRKIANKITMVLSELLDVIYRTIIFLINARDIWIENPEQFAVDVSYEVLLRVGDREMARRHQNCMVNSVATQTREEDDRQMPSENVTDHDQQGVVDEEWVPAGAEASDAIDGVEPISGFYL